MAQFGSPELQDEVLPRTLSGEFRLCLGYTEPEGGSDVATCKTRAVRDGDSWIINGSKMFTSNAHNAAYVFLITNTDPDAPKHQSLTMFLVPLDRPGVEIQPLRTVDGDRTNITYYSDVRVEDKYRIGEVNGGWTVLREALNDEHGTVERDPDGLQKIAAMSEHLVLLAEAVDKIAAHPTADDSVKYRLGRSIARMEAAMSTPEMFGRVAIAQTMRDVSPDLMDILGNRIEPARRYARGRRRRGSRVRLPAGGSDRHLRRHPRGVPQHDRPARARPRPAELLTGGQAEFLELGDHVGGQQFERLVGSAVVGEQHDLPEPQVLQLVRAGPRWRAQYRSDRLRVARTPVSRNAFRRVLERRAATRRRAPAP